MISHDTIWLALDRLAEEMGYSPSGLARKAGLDPTAFNKSKRLSPEGKPRWPSTESIAKVLTVTGQSMERFVLLVEHDGQEHANRYAPHAATSGGARAPIPSLAIDRLSHPHTFTEHNQPAATAPWRAFSPDEVLHNAQDAFAVELTDQQFAPVYRAGDVLVVKPEQQPRRGDRVLAVLESGQGVMIGVFTRSTRDIVELTDLLGQQSVAVPLRQLRLLARILLATQ